MPRKRKHRNPAASIDVEAIARLINAAFRKWVEIKTATPPRPTLSRLNRYNQL